jgi:hypothetical protein
MNSFALLAALDTTDCWCFAVMGAAVVLWIGLFVAQKLSRPGHIDVTLGLIIALGILVAALWVFMDHRQNALTKEKASPVPQNSR